jgi:hypothetical protein
MKPENKFLKKKEEKERSPMIYWRTSMLSKFTIWLSAHCAPHLLKGGRFFTAGLCDFRKNKQLPNF